MRFRGLCIAVGFCAALASGCGEKREEARMGKKGVAYEASKDRRGPMAKGAGRPDFGGADAKKDEVPDGAMGGAGGPPRSREAEDAVAMAGGGRKEPPPEPVPDKPPQPERQAGLLTAGSFDDNLDPAPFKWFVNKMRQNPDLGSLSGRFAGQRLIVTVVGQDGKPLGNARVHLAPAEGGTGVDLVSRSDGNVVFLLGWDGVRQDSDLLVTVAPSDGGKPLSQKIPRGSAKWQVAVPDAKAAPPANLDLAIVLDTTGSMGKELQFLITEIRSIAAAVHTKFPDVRQHYALILYRDQGDEYVVRQFDFTPSVDDFRRNLAAQSAAGGGDYPEAVHEGVEAALKLQWRDKDTARVLFHVADAPPHAQFMERTMAAVEGLRRKGVAIYPVACGGYDDACEFVMRSSALLTGGQFLFLTSDSGVGGPHDEPHIPYYKVQRLEQLMIRMIAGELSGRRIEPEPGQVLRVVGKPVN